MAAGRPPAAFSGAGQRSGLEVWRVERLELVPVPPSHHGDFFVGDAYVVLSTRRTATAVAYRLHYWLGGQPAVRDGMWDVGWDGWDRGSRQGCFPCCPAAGGSVGVAVSLGYLGVVSPSFCGGA